MGTFCSSSMTRLLSSGGQTTEREQSTNKANVRGPAPLGQRKGLLKQSVDQIIRPEMLDSYEEKYKDAETIVMSANEGVSSKPVKTEVRQMLSTRDVILAL